jgi:glucan phosphoethanolaminetransferase (alkaline phosphatase superfamily)
MEIPDLTKISSRGLFLYILIITSVIASGLLFIFVFNSELFLKLDTAKLFLLATAITMPIFTMACFIESLSTTNLAENTENRILLVIVAGAFFTILFIYPVILCRLFCKFDVKIAVLIISVVEISMYIRGVVNRHRIQKK